MRLKFLNLKTMCIDYAEASYFRVFYTQNGDEYVYSVVFAGASFITMFSASVIRVRRWRESDYHTHLAANPPVYA